MADTMSTTSYVVISLNTYLTVAEAIDVPQNKFMNWGMSDIFLPDA